MNLISSFSARRDGHWAPIVVCLTVLLMVLSISPVTDYGGVSARISPAKASFANQSPGTGGSKELTAAQASLNGADLAGRTHPSDGPQFPPLREYAAMTWDPSAGYVLLFGGSNITNPDTDGGTPNLADTWSFSNGSWTELFPSLSPPATDFAAMAYDPNASAVVLFGGQIEETQGAVPVNTTWEFRGGAWTNVTNSVAPSPRLSPSLAADPLRGGLILFGGSQNYPYAVVPESDTWSFLNGTWSNITATVGAPPTARVLAGIAYDPNESGVLLFGGWSDLGGTLPLNDTWVLGQTGWSNATGLSAPPASGGLSLAYLSESDSIILYGGSTPSLGRDYNQTWSFSAGSWTRLLPSEVPPGTFAGTFADDPDAGYGVLLLGAETPYAPASEQTWAFAHGNWSLAGSNSTLPPAGGGTMVYDPAEQAVVLVPNYGTGFASGSIPTWVFSNGSWSKLAATIASGTLLVYDGADGYVMGYETSYDTTSTWEFSNNTWTQLLPSTSPTPGESGGIAYDAHDGYVLYLDATNGRQTSTWAWLHGDWSNLNLVTQPVLHYTLAINTMTYDAADGYVLLVQASNFSCGPAGNCLLTWAFSGGAWTDLTGKSSQTPPVLIDASITYDAGDSKVLLFGGRYWSSNDSLSNQTWAFLGGQWNALAPSTIPTARFYAALTYDPAIGHVLMFGGDGAVPYAGGTIDYPLADTWEFVNDTWTELLPSLSASLARTDVGVPTMLTTVAPSIFGSPSYSYDGLPEGCQSVNSASIDCAPTEPGSFVVTVTVGYSDSVQSTASTTLLVAELPLISGFTSSENPVPVNGTTTLSSTVSGGTTPWTYIYGDLPPGCATANVSSLGCTPTAAGKYSVSLMVSDRFGRSANSTLILSVGSTPSQTSLGKDLAWFATPLGGLLLGLLIVGVAVTSVVLVRGRRLRREGEELLADARKAISDGSYKRNRPP